MQGAAARKYSPDACTHKLQNTIRGSYEPSAKQFAACGNLLSALAAGLVPIALAVVFFVAPTEPTMGQAQRIVYVHVAVAWLALAGFIVMAASGGMYLLRRDLAWDHWARAAAELGWLCCTLTLATGSLWAHAAWNTWWTWDPRLTASFVLWTMYGGYLLIRGSLEDPHRALDWGPSWPSSACSTFRWSSSPRAGFAASIPRRRKWNRGCAWPC